MKNIELEIAFRVISTLSIKGLSIEDIMKVLELMDCIGKKLDKYVEARKKIFDSYKIKSDSDLSNSSERSAINEILEELGNKEQADIQPTGFLSDISKIIENNSSLNFAQMKYVTQLFLKK